MFHRYSKQLHEFFKVPNEYLLYRLSSQNQKPNPVYHFFPKISLSFSCFLLRIPYTILRKSNKNLNSDFYLSFTFWWTDKPSMNIWRKYLTARSQPTSISLKNSEFIQGWSEWLWEAMIILINIPAARWSEQMESWQAMLSDLRKRSVGLLLKEFQFKIIEFLLNIFGLE